MNNRFFCKTVGANVETLEKCIAMAISIANNDVNTSRVVLYSYTKQHFETVKMVFNKKTINKMFKHPILIQGCQKPICCATKKTYYAQNNKDVIVCCHVDSEGAFEVDDFQSARYIIALSWQNNGLDKWIKRWTATDVNNPDTSLISSLTIPPLSIIALNEMDNAMCNSKSLIYPKDKDICKTYIRAIHKYIPTLSADDLADYLVTQLHWKNKYASEISELLQKLKNGRKFRGGEKTGLRNFYKIWCNSLANSTQHSNNQNE